MLDVAQVYMEHYWVVCSGHYSPVCMHWALHVHAEHCIPVQSIACTHTTYRTGMLTADVHWVLLHVVAMSAACVCTRHRTCTLWVWHARVPGVARGGEALCMPGIARVLGTARVQRAAGVGPAPAPGAVCMPWVPPQGPPRAELGVARWQHGPVAWPGVAALSSSPSVEQPPPVRGPIAAPLPGL